MAVRQNQGFRQDLNFEENTNDVQALSNLGGVGVAGDLRVIQNNLRNQSKLPFNNIDNGFFVFNVDKVISINSIVSTASTTENSTEVEVTLVQAYDVKSPNVIVVSGVTGIGSTVYNGEFVTTSSSDNGLKHRFVLPDIQYSGTASGSDVSGATFTFKPKSEFVFTDGDVVKVSKDVNTGSLNLLTTEQYYVCNSDTVTKFQLSTTPPSSGLSTVTVTTTVISNPISDSKSSPGSYDYTLPSTSSNISIKIASGSGGSGGSDACVNGAPNVSGGAGGSGRYAEFTLPDGTSGTLSFSVGGGGGNGLNSGQTNFAGGSGGSNGGGTGGDDRTGGSSGGGGGGGGYTSVSLDGTIIAVAGGGAGGGGGSLCNYSGPVNSPYAYEGGDGGTFSTTTSTISISNGGNGVGGSLGGDGGGSGGGGGGAPGGNAGSNAGNDQQGGAAPANRAYGGLGGSSVYRSDILSLSSESTYTASNDGYLEISYTYTTTASSVSTPQTITIGISTVTVSSISDSTFSFLRLDKVTQENLVNYIQPEIQDDEEFGGYLTGSINDVFENTQQKGETADYFVTKKYKGTDDTETTEEIKIEGVVTLSDPGNYNTTDSALADAKSPGIFIGDTRAFSSDNNPWVISGSDLATDSHEVSIGELFFANNITVTGIGTDYASGTEVDVTSFTHKVPVTINGETYYLLLRT